VSWRSAGRPVGASPFAAIVTVQERESQRQTQSRTARGIQDGFSTSACAALHEGRPSRRFSLALLCFPAILTLPGSGVGAAGAVIKQHILGTCGVAHKLVSRSVSEHSNALMLSNSTSHGASAACQRPIRLRAACNLCCAAKVCICHLACLLASVSTDKLLLRSNARARDRVVGAVAPQARNVSTPSRESARSKARGGSEGNHNLWHLAPTEERAIEPSRQRHHKNSPFWMPRMTVSPRGGGRFATLLLE
jgi:hypothetical protein